MTVTVLIVFAALIWLGIETRWLTIRLLIPSVSSVPFPKSILQMALGFIFVAVGFVIFGDIKSLEHLPKYYRRYIERVRKSSGDILWLPPESFHPVLINEMRQKVVIALREGIENASK